MNLSETFEVMSGSTAGRRHRTTGNLANNQDAVKVLPTASLIVGSVSDGCGSQPHSEFGSQLMVNGLSTLVTRHLHQGGTLDEDGFGQIYSKLVRRIKTVATTMLDGPTVEALNQYLMATAGGFALTAEELVFYGAGDFTIVVNGEVIIWEPEEGNMPLYPALSLAFPNDNRFKFRVHRVPTVDVQSFMFATDGGEELLRVLGDDFECVPGTDDPAGPVKKIWTTDEFYKDTAACGLWLNSLAQNWRMPGPPHHGGLLDDDTTLIAGRRKETVTA